MLKAQPPAAAEASILVRQAATTLPTPYGDFELIAYATTPDEPMPHLALRRSKKEGILPHPTLVRLHSECMTGDVFGSYRCDCGEQLHQALERIALEGGVLIYLRQEGRGIGLIAKLRAYNLQDAGFDTAHANTELGFEVDARRYDDAIFMLQDLGVTDVRLLTNNPLKLDALGSEINVVERVPLVIAPRPTNDRYLRTKRELMGHLAE